MVIVLYRESDVVGHVQDDNVLLWMWPIGVAVTFKLMWVSDLFTSYDAPYFHHTLIILQQVALNHKVRELGLGSD